MREYKIANVKGRFDLLHPDEYQFRSTIRIYENGEELYRLFLDDDKKFLCDGHETPWELADIIRRYLEQFFIFTSREKYLKAAEYLEKHADELWRNRLKSRREELLKELAEVEKELDALGEEEEK